MTSRRAWQTLQRYALQGDDDSLCHSEAGVQRGGWRTIVSARAIDPRIIRRFSATLQTIARTTPDS